MSTELRRQEPRSIWDMFDEAWGGSRLPSWAAQATQERALAPPMDISETDKEFVITVEVPGAKQDDIHVSFQDNVLTINAEVKEVHDEKKDGRLIRQERRYGRYVRSLRIGADVNADAIGASYNDGLLRVTLPKAPEAQPRRIDVKVG